MMKTISKLLAGTAMMWAAALPMQAQKNPILPEWHADPDVIADGGRYYIYSTTDGAPGWGGYFFTCYSSKNLKDWRYEGTILDLKKDTKWAKGNAWAPAIEKKNGKFYFYFSGDQGERKAIGVAVSDSPTGPFRDFGRPIVDKRPEGVKGGQQIDVDVFTDDDGQSYLYWGNGYMAGAKLNDDMTSIDESSVTVMTPRGGSLQDYAYREAPYVFKRNKVAFRSHRGGQGPDCPAAASRPGDLRHGPQLGASDTGQGQVVHRVPSHQQALLRPQGRPGLPPRSVHRPDGV